MYLDDTQEKRALNLYEHLKRQDVDCLKTIGIEKCEKCSGTGLSKIFGVEGDIGWIPGNYCEKCSGLGFVGVLDEWQVDLIHYVCRKCGGSGCSKCKYKGVVDWVAHTMGE
jgi:DnaJ-class molecular chaperone